MDNNDNNDNNDNKDILKNGLNNNEKISQKECINELLSFKFPISNRENNKEYNKEEDSNNNLMDKIKKMQLKMKINSKKNFKKNLLNELSLGNDIFKLNLTKFRVRKSKQEYKIKKCYKKIKTRKRAGKR